MSRLGGFNIGGINATGQVTFYPSSTYVISFLLKVPSMPGNWGLIDLETPKEAYTVPSWSDSSQQLQLVFSDEFNTEGRSFYPGDDPYWEAADLYYWVILTPDYLQSTSSFTISYRPQTIWSGMTHPLSLHKMVLSLLPFPKRIPII